MGFTRTVGDHPAATNRADILDKALLRAGRFDRQIHVDLLMFTNAKKHSMHLRPGKSMKRWMLILAKQLRFFRSRYSQCL